jgi:hypothetical protein
MKCAREPNNDVSFLQVIRRTQHDYAAHDARDDDRTETPPEFARTLGRAPFAFVQSTKH